MEEVAGNRSGIKFMFNSFILLASSAITFYSGHCPEKPIVQERPINSITQEDFQQLLKQRLEGFVGLHNNRESMAMKPAGDDAVLNWSNLSDMERLRFALLQEEMFRQGKIAMIVLAGGEATRFGGPKTFVSISNELGEFLEIKAANIRWVEKKFRKSIPLFILSSEKRIEDFKNALRERNYYGLNPHQIKWLVQGTVNSFIPTPEEITMVFHGLELEDQLKYAFQLRKENPDGIYRFNGEERKVPTGHFDAISSFIISGGLSEALSEGIEYISIVNIDNLQAILKNDGMIACFAEKGDDFGFLLAEKNLLLSIKDKATGQILQPKVFVRFRDRVLSFDGITEWLDEADQNGYRYVINQTKKSVSVYDLSTGLKLKTEKKVKAETGGTLVQLLSPEGELFGVPLLKEGFELPENFEHSKAPFFNTNTLMIRLRSLLSILEISEEALKQMTFDERLKLVQKKLLEQLKVYFEFKNHVVEGEFPNIGIVKEGKTKITVSQITRILLQVVQLKGVKVSYLLAPRDAIFAPVKEPEDKTAAAIKHAESLKQYTLYSE